MWNPYAGIRIFARGNFDKQNSVIFLYQRCAVLYLVNVKPHQSKLRIVAWLVDLCYITYFAFPHQTTIFQNTEKKNKQKTCKHNNNSRFVVPLFID